jgi:hypothetical protein
VNLNTKEASSAEKLKWNKKVTMRDLLKVNFKKLTNETTLKKFQKMSNPRTTTENLDLTL